MKAFQEPTKILAVFMQEMVNINKQLKSGKRNYHLLKQTWKKLGYIMKLVVAILNWVNFKATVFYFAVI